MFGGVLAITVGGAAFLLLSPPTGLIRDRLAAEIKSRTGRDLVIKGDARLTLIPSLGIALGDVTLSAPPSMPGPPLIQTEQLEVRLALMPLLTREVTIERLVLRKPVIELRIDGQGRRSWDFAEAEGLRQPNPVRYAQVNPRGPDGKPLPRDLADFAKNATDKVPARSRLGGVNDLSLGDVRISEGTVRYVDARQGLRLEATNIDGRLSLRELAGPLVVGGSLTVSGERVDVDARVASLKDALDELPTAVNLKLGAKALQASYDGMLTTSAGPPGVDGRIALKAPSLDALAALLRVPLAGFASLGAIDVDGQLKVAGQSYALADASIAIGETRAKGAIGVETAGARPLIKPNLKFAVLDLNQLTSATPTIAAAPAPRAGPGPLPASPPPAERKPEAGRFASPKGLGPAPAPAQSIEDLIKRTEEEAGQPGPKVRGFTRRSSEGWSSEPLNPAALRLVDIDGRIDAEKILWQAVKIGQTQTGIQLKAGVLRIDVGQLELYGGRAKALVSLDAREPQLTLGANVSGDGIQALPFLKDAADLDVIDGKSRLIVAVSAKGGSERELIGTLAGKAELKLTDGAVLGWDAGQMLGGLGQGRIPGFDRTANARTPFTDLSGTFQIANGVARNQDLRLESPAMRATGSGVVNIVDQNLNMVVKTKAAVAGLGSIEVPVRIAGPFDKVSVIPEGGVEQLQGVAKQLNKHLQDGKVDDVLRGVLGNDPKADEKIGKAKDFLRQFVKP